MNIRQKIKKATKQRRIVWQMGLKTSVDYESRFFNNPKLPYVKIADAMRREELRGFTRFEDITDETLKKEIELIVSKFSFKHNGPSRRCIACSCIMVPGASYVYAKCRISTKGKIMKIISVKITENFV